MRRAAVVSIALLGLVLFSSVGGGPKAPAFSDDPVVFTPALLDHIWYWTCEEGNPHQKFIHFLPDGTARYDYEQGAHPESLTYHNATWEIRDRVLYIVYNNGYATDTFPLGDAVGDALVGIPAKTRHCPAVYMSPVQ